MVAMSARLWLVRHGATDWSDAGRLTGWSDIPLNDVGRRQAQVLRRRLVRIESSPVPVEPFQLELDTPRGGP
jgi:broad specificity phosphatase PhoE